jgi:hypothetical protein
VIVTAYLYWPVVYFAVYLPFILPRLPAWDHIPAAIVAAVLGGYVTVLVAAGRALDHRRIVLHTVGIAVSIYAFSLVMASLSAPAFLKAFEGGFDPWDVLATAAHAVVVLVFLEAGRALGRLASTRRSAA